MRRVTLSKWVLAIIFYTLLMYFSIKGIKVYYNKFLVPDIKMSELQLTSFLSLIALCCLASYNFLSFTKRYFKGMTKKKRRQ